MKDLKKMGEMFNLDSDLSSEHRSSRPGKLPQTTRRMRTGSRTLMTTLDTLFGLSIRALGDRDPRVDLAEIVGEEFGGFFRTQYIGKQR